MQKEVKQFKNKLKIKAAENSKDRLIHTSFLTKVTCWNHRKSYPQKKLSKILTLCSDAIVVLSNK